MYKPMTIVMWHDVIDDTGDNYRVVLEYFWEGERVNVEVLPAAAAVWKPFRGDHTIYAKLLQAAKPELVKHLSTDTLKRYGL